MVLSLYIVKHEAEVIQYFGNELKSRGFSRGIAMSNQRVFVEQMVNITLDIVQIQQ